MLTLRPLDNNQPSLEVNRPRLSVGRDAGNDLVLDDDSVSGFHAELFFENDRLEVVDLGSTNGTWLDEQPLRGRKVVGPWQRLRFGSVAFEVIDDQARRPTRAMPAVGMTNDGVVSSGSAVNAPTAPPPTGPVRAYLHKAGTGSGPESVTVHDALTIGRAPDNQLVLASEQVSSHHARLEWQDGTMSVIDLGSTNGTWVDGQRVHRQALKTGDRVAFDENAYTFRRGGEDSLNKTRLNPAIGNSSGTAPRPAVPQPPPLPTSAPTRTIPAPTATAAEPRAAAHSAPTTVQPSISASAPTGPVSSVSADPPLDDRPRFWPFVALSRYAEFSGRSRRKEYWWFFLFQLVVAYATLFLDFTLGLYDPMSGEPGVLIWLLALALFLPALAAQVRRLHDTDRSGWWILIGLIPIIGSLILIVFYALDGTPGQNRFGPDPQGRGG